jgi:hypothetical protein
MTAIRISITIPDLAKYIKANGLMPVLATDPQGFCDMLKRSFDPHDENLILTGEVIP